jgi:two-component system, LuxR family, sensor kinase FixL
MPELWLASLLDAASDAMLVAAADGRILFFNKACENLLGYDAAQIIGRSVRSLLPPTGNNEIGNDRISNDLAACFGSLCEHRRVGMRARGGSAVSVEVTLSAAPTPAGQQYLVVLRPATAGGSNPQENQCEGELAQAARQSALEDVGSAFAHKLNQPLTAVILYLQAVERAYGRETAGSPLPEPVAAILGKAVHEAERASSMLHGLRHGRDSDRERSHFTDINQAVGDAIDLAGFHGRRQPHIDRILAPGLPSVSVDCVELQQALVALIRGTLDEAGRRHADGIRLTTGCWDGHVAVVAETAVNGGGEFADNCAVSTNGRRNCEKDLAVARAIARSHGGDLVVDADGSDHGARFTLRLPLPAGTTSLA